MNEELVAYITRLCELSGHTTRIKKDLILVEPREGYTDVFEAFTMVEEYYAYGHVERYSFGGEKWLIPNEGGWRGWRVGLGVGVEVFT